MHIGKRSRSNSYDDIEYYHASKKFKCYDGSSYSVWPFRKLYNNTIANSEVPFIFY